MPDTNIELSKNIRWEGDVLRIGNRSQLKPNLVVIPIVVLTGFSALSPNMTVEFSTTSPLGDPFDWHIYAVDTTERSGGSTSIAIDSDNNPHIAYNHYQNGSLNHAHWDGTSWQIEVVDWEDNTGYSPSIAIDSSNNIHIAYFTMQSKSGKDFELRYALFDGSSWSVRTVDDGSDYGVGMWPSLALNSNEYPNISYHVSKWPSSDDELRYAHWDGTSWKNETIAVGGSRITRSSLDMDDQHDHPHICHIAHGGLNYTYWNGSSWNTERVAPRDASWLSMKLNKTGEPLIAFNHNKPAVKPKILKYAVRLNGTWNMTDIDGSKDPSVSLALENLETPHISYRSLDDTLKHAYYDGQKWMTEVVDNTSFVGPSSIIVDKRGNLYISYADYDNETLKLATTRELKGSEIDAEIDIHPNTLNLKSKGNFITAHIELEGAIVRDINVSSIKLNGAISPILDEKHGFVTSEDSYIVDHDNDGKRKMKVKFDRAEVQRILIPADEVVLTISGSLYDGRGFVGHDTIRVIDPP